LIGLGALLGVTNSSWEMATGHHKDGQFIVIRTEGLKKAHIVRMHNLIEGVLSEELGEGDRF
jgi:hypothetical protein